MRDELSNAPAIVLGCGHLPFEIDTSEISSSAEIRSSIIRQYNDGRALTAFRELHACYVPLRGHAPLEATTTPLPLTRMNESLKYHTAAPLASWLDILSFPMKDVRNPITMPAFLDHLQVRPNNHLGCAVLGLPHPCCVQSSQGGEEEEVADKSLAWMSPMAPLQLSPDFCVADAQICSQLGVPVGSVTGLKCRSASASMCWSRQDPLFLPLSFPQFFQSRVIAQMPSIRNSVDIQNGEVHSLPGVAALQSGNALGPLLGRVRDGWRRHRKQMEVVSRDHGMDVDQMSEIIEDLEGLCSSYPSPQL